MKAFFGINQMPVLFIEMLRLKSFILLRIKLQTERRVRSLKKKDSLLFREGIDVISTMSSFHLTVILIFCLLIESLLIYPLHLSLSSLHRVGWEIKIWFPLVTASVSNSWSMMPGYVTSLFLPCLLLDSCFQIGCNTKKKKVWN